MKIKREKCICCDGTGQIYSASTALDPCPNCNATGIIETVVFEPTKSNSN